MSDNSSHEGDESKTKIMCQYGAKCYQKNPAHLAKYKHPTRTKRKNEGKGESSKRIKVNDQKPEKIANKETVKQTVADEESKLETISSSDFATSEEDKKEVISSSDSENSNNKVINTNREEQLDAVEKDNKEQTSRDDKNENTTFNSKAFIASRFLVNLPRDFFDFWSFCQKLNPKCPSKALSNVDLELVGPFDVLAEKFKHVKKSPEEYLQHWRYYYDPPEVLTVIRGDNKRGYHIGYLFDSPNESPPCLVSNDGVKNGVFTKIGENIFAAVSLYLEDLKKACDPFKKIHVTKLQSSIKATAEELSLSLAASGKQIHARESRVVGKTLNKIGIVVPYDKKTQLGYRKLAMSDKELMTLLTKLDQASPEQKDKYLSDLQPVLTYANIALDECDFGTGVKLGWELLYHGIDSLNSTIAKFLGNSYRLLNKEAFAKIAEAHMKNRRKGCDLSII